jgi:3-hydroxybutyryl-CoA dehydrogenase
MSMAIKTIGVVGSGTMGGGIAQVAAQSGLTVHLYDVKSEMLEKATAQIDEILKKSVTKGKLSDSEANAIKARIITTTDLADFKDCDCVIEAAPEILDLKQKIFHDLEQIVRPDCILATNTSTLSVTSIGSQASHQERVVGMHFFNPPPLMPLIEVIGSSATSEAVIAATLDLARTMGKTPVRVKDTPGFIVNRVARPFYLEGLRLLGEGVADHATLDKLIKGGGKFRMGPFELMDLIGLDINYAASQSVYDAFFHEPRFRPSVLQQRMVESGRLGRKTGHGWYEYEDK